MPDISDVLQPYANAIYKAHEARKTRKSRRLGGSLIGEKCDRKIWYKFRQVKTEKVEGRVLRLWETGHIQEARIIEELREAGHTVTHVGKDQVEFEWCDGHMVDKPDGIIDGKYVSDEKTMNDKNFKKLDKEGFSDKYNVQMSLHIEGALEHGLIPKPGKGIFLAINKNDESIIEKKVPRNSRLAKSTIQKADRIIHAPFPPGRLSDDPSYYECKWCDLHSLCHKGGDFEFSCRTCIHSDPVENGKWNCSKLGLTMAKGFDEIENCEHYQQIENR